MGHNASHWKAAASDDLALLVGGGECLTAWIANAKVPHGAPVGSSDLPEGPGGFLSYKVRSGSGRRSAWVKASLGAVDGSPQPG